VQYFDDGSVILVSNENVLFLEQKLVPKSMEVKLEQDVFFNQPRKKSVPTLINSAGEDVADGCRAFSYDLRSVQDSEFTVADLSHN
jgi:hypothetical protein